MLLLRSDRLLLALAGGLLFFGGGIGCEPVLSGVDFRAKSRPSIPGNRASPPDWYMAFGGKKAPGNGDAQLPYALVPPFSVAARMGVFEERALAASAGAEGCIGLRDTGSPDEHELCARYDDEPPAVFVRYAGEQAECPGAERAELELAVDAGGVDLVVRYRCPGGAFQELTTVDALWDAGEEWNAFVSASALAKGGQAAFDNFVVESGDVGFGDPREIVFLAFEAFRLALEAFYELEDGDPSQAPDLATEAVGKLQAVSASVDDDAVRKLVDKAASSLAKLLVSAAKYQKGFPKFADVEAAALEALEAGR
jgi:hypothetical protein